MSAALEKAWQRAWLLLLALLLLGGCSGDDPALWRRVGGGWQYDGRAFTAADPASLVVLDGRFARDAVQAYYRGTPVPGSHGPSFQVLGEHEARDRQAVYWADTYRQGQEYWTVRHVRVETIEGAEPASYQVRAYDHGRDARHAYREGRRLEAVLDGASFEVLTRSFARDARRGYFDGRPIADSDGASFRLVDATQPGWVRDAQAASFVLVDTAPAAASAPAAGEEADARDARGFFHQGRRLGPRAAAGNP